MPKLKLRPAKANDPGPRPSRHHKLVSRNGTKYWLNCRRIGKARARWAKWARGLAKHLGMPPRELVIRLMLAKAEEEGYQAPKPRQLPKRPDFFRPHNARTRARKAAYDAER